MSRILTRHPSGHQPRSAFGARSAGAALVSGVDVAGVVELSELEVAGVLDVLDESDGVDIVEGGVWLGSVLVDCA